MRGVENMLVTSSKVRAGREGGGFHSENVPHVMPYVVGVSTVQNTVIPASDVLASVFLSVLQRLIALPLPGLSLTCLTRHSELEGLVGLTMEPVIQRV
jgi:hypothetical protein